MEIREIFSGLYHELEGEFRKSAQIDHAGGKGAHRESALRRLMAKYLPRRFSCGTGTLVSTSGRSSRQCDIVIHDDFYETPLLKSEEHSIFAAGTVFGVIESKSTLSSHELELAYENIRSAKKTASREDFFGGIVGFTAGRTLDAVANQVAELNSQIGDDRLKTIPDCIAILDQGIVEPYGSASNIRILRSERNTLAWFFFEALKKLNEIQLKPEDFHQYLSLPVQVAGLSVHGHDRFVRTRNDGEPCVCRLKDDTVRRIYDTCQTAGRQQLIGEEKLERIRNDPNSFIGCLVVGTGFVYNPNCKKIILYEHVTQWSRGKAIVGPDELYPHDSIRIGRETYYLDMNVFDDSDFEENPSLTVGEQAWEFVSSSIKQQTKAKGNAEQDYSVDEKSREAD